MSVADFIHQQGHTHDNAYKWETDLLKVLKKLFILNLQLSHNILLKETELLI